MNMWHVFKIKPNPIKRSIASGRDSSTDRGNEVREYNFRLRLSKIFRNYVMMV